MKNLTSKEINQIIADNWYSKKTIDIALLIGRDPSVVRNRARQMKLKPRVIESEDNYEVSFSKEKEKKLSKSSQTKLEEKYKFLLEKNIDLEEKLKILERSDKISTFTIKPSKSTKSEATAIVLASDWHVGETVDPETIGGVNQYNRLIASARGKEFFNNTLRILKVFEKDITIKHMVLALLGDFITNTIHEELAETNSMLPSDEIVFAQDLIASGIQHLLDNTTVDIVVPCHSGNHGRMTKKQRISSEAGNSLEFYMYQNIAWHFKGNKRIKFVIPRSYFSYIQVYDKIVRFSHGHHTQYGGGVGGITIPINKAIAQWNKTRRADIDCFGHFHQFLDGGYWICNGSMMGFNAYAESIKAGFEKPKQCFFLIDKNRGKTVVAPIVFT